MDQRRPQPSSNGTQNRIPRTRVEEIAAQRLRAIIQTQRAQLGLLPRVQAQPQATMHVLRLRQPRPVTATTTAPWAQQQWRSTATTKSSPTTTGAVTESESGLTGFPVGGTAAAEAISGNEEQESDDCQARKYFTDKDKRCENGPLGELPVCAEVKTLSIYAKSIYTKKRSKDMLRGWLDDSFGRFAEAKQAVSQLDLAIKTLSIEEVVKDAKNPNTSSSETEERGKRQVKKFSELFQYKR